MTSRHHLLADIEDQRRKRQEDSIDQLSWDLVSAADASGYDPYDNPGAVKAHGTVRARRKKGRRRG